ncbi:heparinase II/III family protein [Pedobacter riviphilus]|uniref:Heparinase II/III family protein n=1 Tax=Pedobacter riviphilus TaxID=2766984 RepID=A0ABX6TMA1_9SPHI|nr:heparinase II/III family protein [Pedobacter riviphilus]QNR86692.1 heparinase II/III family protein [Pedobacter riviphilus]
MVQPIKKNQLVTIIFTIITLFCSTLAVGQNKEIDSAFKMPLHPRLLISHDLEKQILENVKRDTKFKQIHQAILSEADHVLNKQVLERVMIGKRLLNVSREALKRIYYLSYAFRLSHDKKYVTRAEKELLVVSGFKDWNPSHFLDVGEMTMALSIGYDWLYQDLPQSTRNIVALAILEKGIKPSTDNKYNNWLNITNNWNQVCNAGISFGAIATFEEHPALSAKLINRAIKSITLPMKQYAPDGAYPEGYGYWEYGTTFNVMFISALESVFHQDFDLSAQPGFLKTADYLDNMMAPSGKPFNYSDCGANAEFNPALFWFASKLNDPRLLWITQKQLDEQMPLKNRLLPSAMIWGAKLSLSNIQPKSAKFWIGNGPTPVALMRSSWTDPLATFVGFKGGSPSVSHGHMDVGSFIMESQGVRWAMDFGMQEYESLESKGINLWDSKQNAQRWKIFRYNNFAHNTLSIDSTLQNVKGDAAFIRYSDNNQFMNAVADLSTLYADKLKKSIRGVALVDKKTVLIRDEITVGNTDVTLRWSMVTPATVEIINGHTIELSYKNKKCYLTVDAESKVKMKTWSTDPVTDYDAKNPGTSIVGFEVRLKADSEQAISVFLDAENPPQKNFSAKPIASWPKK